MGSQKQNDTAKRSRERGATLFIFTMSLFLLIGMGALAIDLASMYVARSQSQRAADAAAMAGAKYFVESGCVTNGTCNNAIYTDTATARATQVAALSLISGQPVTLVAAPVYNFGQAQNPQITVAVQTTSLKLYFLPAVADLASIVGANGGTNNNIVVGATATAEAYNPSGFGGGPTYCTGCVRPWLIPNCDQTNLSTPSGSNPLCTVTSVPLPPSQGYLLTPGTYGVDDPGCASGGGVIGEQITMYLPTPTTPGALPLPTTLYGGLDIDNPGLGNFFDYQNAITTCATGQTTCGQPTLGLLPINGTLSTSTAAGVAALLHVASPPSLGLGQDYINTPVTCPPQIHAGAANPLVTQGIVAQDTVISTSDSIVSAYIYDSLGPGYSGLAYNLVGTTAQTVKIVGFAEIFITSSDANGNVSGIILGVAGCGNNAGGACGLGSGNGTSINGPTLIPVRLIHN